MAQIKTQIIKLPHKPGVYLYKNTAGEIIYVGKAKDLKKRVQQYFRTKTGLDSKTSALVAQIASIETILTVSEFDALLLEAKLINSLKPKYNLAARDDKSPLYIIISLNRDKPGVFTRRGREVNKLNRRTDTVFGPFQSGRTTRMLLQTIRRIIPYCTQKRFSGRPCFYTQIGLCNPCPSEFMKQPEEQRVNKWLIYKRNLQRISKLLSGKARSIEVDFAREMDEFGRAERFEEAALIRNQLQALRSLLEEKYDTELYITEESFLINKTSEEKEVLRRVLTRDLGEMPELKRIECVDMSNTGGKQAVGSMVVLTDGIPDNSQYRRFKIRQGTGANDVGQMKELLERRLGHKEWEAPDLLIVDGGKGQVQMAWDLLKEWKMNIPVVGLAKRREEIILLKDGKFKVIRLGMDSPAIHLLQRVRDEAHRFGLNYHRYLRKREFLTL